MFKVMFLNINEETIMSWDDNGLGYQIVGCNLFRVIHNRLMIPSEAVYATINGVMHELSLVRTYELLKEYCLSFNILIPKYMISGYIYSENTMNLDQEAVLALID